MEHQKLTEFSNDFYGDQPQQLTKLKVHGKKVAKENLFGIVLSVSLGKHLKRDQWRSSRRSLSPF